MYAQNQKGKGFNCSIPKCVNWQTTGFFHENGDATVISNSSRLFCSKYPFLFMKTTIGCNKVEVGVKQKAYAWRKDKIKNYNHKFSIGHFGRLTNNSPEYFGTQWNNSFNFICIEKSTASTYNEL